VDARPRHPDGADGPVLAPGGRRTPARRGHCIDGDPPSTSRTCPCLLGSVPRGLRRRHPPAVDGPRAPRHAGRRTPARHGHPVDGDPPSTSWTGPCLLGAVPRGLRRRHPPAVDGPRAPRQIGRRTPARRGHSVDGDPPPTSWTGPCLLGSVPRGLRRRHPPAVDGPRSHARGETNSRPARPCFSEWDTPARSREPAQEANSRQLAAQGPMRCP